jgi:hypothetical protein
MSKQVGATKVKDARCLPVGAFVEGEQYLSWMQFFPSPFMPFILSVISFFIAFFFLFVQEIIRGHCPGVVTSGDSVTHKYFHRNDKAGS